MGSNPSIGSKFNAALAQLVEHTLGMGKVIGSTPISSSKNDDCLSFLTANCYQAEYKRGC